MQVKVKLFATLRENREKEMLLDLDKETTIRDVVEYLNIPEIEVAIMLINGRHQNLDAILEDNDTLSLFPPVGGG